MKRYRNMLLLLFLLVAGTVGYMSYLGYFGGRLMTEVAATARPAPADRGTVAVLLSGDMGSRVGMSPDIARRLAARGIPVTLVNSLVYFRERRTPAEATALIVAASRRALAQQGARRLILIGQSYGADMLHVGLAAYPAQLRQRVDAVALIVPETTVDYRASPSELLSFTKPDAAAMATARLLDWVPVICIQGVEEVNSLCPILELPRVNSIALPGGHPLHRDGAALFAALEAGIGWARQPAIANAGPMS